MRGIQTVPALVCVALLVVLTIGCQTKSPEEQIADIRASYSATVNQGGFVATARVPEPAMPEPVEGEEGMEEGDSAMDDEADSMADPASGDSLMDEPVVAEPVRYDITLDILVATGGRETLPQLTIDVVHLDGQEVEKQRWPVTFDTSRILQGPGAQIVHKLEDVAYEAGDIFYTEVRHPIPAEERGKYPEFSPAP
ncbi:MAG: hypothetical protein K0U98_04680 [Deltaproteobacteria bacterium]|nr:hypothetical protein [Deltaproteobacteria bacterium]